MSLSVLAGEGRCSLSLEEACAWAARGQAGPAKAAVRKQTDAARAGTADKTACLARSHTCPQGQESASGLEVSSDRLLKWGL